MTREFPSEGAELALAIYVEDLARGARVLWMGDASSGAARLTASARSLDVLPPPRRSRGRGRGTRLSQRGWLGPEDAESYQLVVVPDALASGLADAGRLQDVRRSVAPGGVVVLATEAHNGSYERFYQHVAGAFETVRMLGVGPFAGLSIVDFASADGSSVSLDGSAVEGAAQDSLLRWIALCGTPGADLEPYLVVQLPGLPSTGPLLAAAEALDAPAPPPAPSPAASPATERELEAARARLEHAEKRLEQAQREIARGAQKLDELRHEAERANLALAEKALAEKERAEQERPPAAAAEPDAAIAEEIESLEERLRAQGRELTELRVEAERRGTMVRDLVEALAAARSVAPVAVAPPSAAPGASEAVLLRLAEAEAARAASAFRADELAGEVATLRQQLEHARAAIPREDTARIRVELAQEAGAKIDAIRAESTAQLERQRAEVVRLGAARAEAVQALETARAELEATKAGFAAQIDAVRAEANERLQEARVAAAAELARERSAQKERESKGEGRAAERDGTVRGLMSRAAELNEMRLQTEARLALAEADLQLMRQEIRRLEAALGATQEELELALLRRGHGIGQAQSQAAIELAEALAERGQLESELQRLRSAVVVIENEREAAQESARRAVASIEVERDAALSATRALEEQVASLRGVVAAHEAGRGEADAVKGELSGLRLRLTDAEAALAEHLAKEKEREALRAELESAQRERDALRNQRSETEGALGGLRTEHGALAERAARAESERDEAQKRAASLVARIAARDGLLAGRESALAHAAEKERELAERSVREIASLEERLRGSQESLSALEAVTSVREGEQQREDGVLRTELDAARAQLRRALEASASARRALEEVRIVLAKSVEGSRLVVVDPATASGAASSRDLDRLRRELDDRELMLRSLTAQLEDRDDRLRALERGRGASVPGDADELRQRLLVAEERENRLRAELEATARRQPASSESAVDKRRLEQQLADREAHAMQTEGALVQARREEQLLREVIAQTRRDVEAALSGVGIEPAGDTAERLAEALRLLQRL